jgi:hypothetical protein
VTPTEQPRSARRLLRRIVGRPPEKPPGKVSSTIFLLVFVVGFSLAVLSWWGGPSLSDLSIACVMLGSLLFGPGSATTYHRWRGELAGDLVRLGGMALFYVGLSLLIAEMALTGHWGWVWYSAIVLALCVVVAVAGHYYGPEAEARSEDANPEGRDPIN